MSAKSTTSSGGIGILGLLGIVFVTLKLLGITDVATWSWLLVTLPFWGTISLCLSIMALIFIIAALCAVFDR